jgi:hypothetical protein
LKNILKQKSTLVGVDDPSYLHGFHFDWDTLEVWVCLVFVHFQPVEVVVDVNALGIGDGDNLIVPWLIDFKNLLFEHLLGLHWKFSQVSAEGIIICQRWHFINELR